METIPENNNRTQCKPNGKVYITAPASMDQKTLRRECGKIQNMRCAMKQPPTQKDCISQTRTAISTDMLMGRGKDSQGAPQQRTTSN